MLEFLEELWEFFVEVFSIVGYISVVLLAIRASAWLVDVILFGGW